MDTHRRELVDKLANHLIKTFSKKDVPVVQSFVQHYLMSVSSKDLLEKSIPDLFGSIVSHWNFLQKRNTSFKVRAYNPTFSQHSWSSPHTIVEISAHSLPFLLDSARIALHDLGLQIYLLVELGSLCLTRDNKGVLKEFSLSKAPRGSQGSEISLYFEVSRQDDKELKSIETKLESLFYPLEGIVEDFPAMLESIDKTFCGKKEVAPSAKEFCHWLKEENFVFLAHGDFHFDPKKGLLLEKSNAKGLFRTSFAEDILFSHHREQFKEVICGDQALLIGKFHHRSVIHRPAYLDALYVKKLSKKTKKIESVSIILGLFTAKAYKSSFLEIPFLQEKMLEIFDLGSLDKDSHQRKQLTYVIDTFDVDDFFSAKQTELFQMVFEVFQIKERPLIKLFALPDLFGNFYSCYVYVPRDIFHSTLREKIQEVLLSGFSGETIEFQTRFSESILARIHFVIRGENLKFDGLDIEKIEQDIQQVCRHWKDDFQDLLIEALGEQKGSVLFSSFRLAFSPSYCDRYTPRQAVSDVKFIEKLENKTISLNFFQSLGDNNNFRLKIFQKDKSLILSEVIPILESFGLKVLKDRLFEIHRKEGTVWLNDFSMCLNESALSENTHAFPYFIEAFERIWENKAQYDKFNELVLTSALHISHIVIIRSIAKYLRQIQFNFSQPYIEATCCQYPELIKQIIHYFELKFDPVYGAAADPKRLSLLEKAEEQILLLLEGITNLDQDIILRRYFDVIKAMVRTNFFQKGQNTQRAEYLSFKFDPRQIPDVPQPVVRHEIYVYSPKFEGIHLRTGDVARGGLRWSDRLEDYRTEVLGLVKAQQLKNSLIVPEGAKGGFIVKEKMTLMTPEEKKAVVVNAYENFVRGLLSITDNYHEGQIVTPKDTVAYDELNPYLVVAADKGTATFSDIANAISDSYNFWLRDAFASGGSHGYDHKKMGITAKGAWEAVKRHFKELSLDPQENIFTTVGIGDMSGDVFGNGVLLSEKMQLVAAFNHLHIFLDPNPDVQESFQERKKLFELGRGSWDLYNKDLISEGGGVFSRRDKAIPLSPQVQEMLGTSALKLNPNELIKALLTLPVDLIFNGGIGTFVKSSSQTDLQVGDKANDQLRVNGRDLKAKVFAEGGNLGVTQKGRIEFALSGGAINTDALDNSGGVDCSDHEVNIKIFLHQLIDQGKLSQEKRNALLLEMTEEVSYLVLQNNYRQNKAISYAAHFSLKDLNLHERVIDDLTKRGKLNRSLQGLPSKEEMLQRSQEGIGLTRPELFTIFSVVKLDLKQQLVQFPFEKYPLIEKLILKEFPNTLVTSYEKELLSHPLKSEILSTIVSNILIDEFGFTYPFRLIAETKSSLGEIMSQTLVARSLFDIESLLTELDSLTQVSQDKVQFAISCVCRLVRRSTRWFLSHKQIDYDLHKWRREIQDLGRSCPKLLNGLNLEAFQSLTEDLVSTQMTPSLAEQIALLPHAVSYLDLIALSEKTALSTVDLAKIYFNLGQRLSLDYLTDHLASMSVGNYWEALSRSALRDDIDRYQIQIVESMIDSQKEQKSYQKCFQSWEQDNTDLLEKWDQLLEQIRSDSEHQKNFLLYTVCLRELKNFL